MKKFISIILSFIILVTSLNIVYVHAAGSAITSIYGWYEAIHIEWSNDAASEAMVYYKKSSDSTYLAVDNELIRDKGTGCEADIVGITSGLYDVKIKTELGQVLEEKNISVARHDRSGYGFWEIQGGLGGYKEDGTPKDNAQIVYITNDNKNSVKLGSYTGLANIIKNASKNAPLIIRIIGTVDTQTRDADGTKTTDIKNGVVAIDGLTDKELSADSYFNMMDVNTRSNITVEGIGTNAVIEKWGFTFSKCNSIEIRNLTFRLYPEDACSFEGSSSSNSSYKNFWVHNNYFLTGDNKYDLTEEQDKHEGDGSSDFKGCRNITYSYNVFEKCHKTSLHGGGDGHKQYNSTWHHNYFNASSSRLPLTRQVNLHSYNNYFYKGSKCIDARASAWVLAENNYFDRSTGLLTTAHSTYGDPIVKSIGNTFDGSSTSDNAHTITTTTDRALSISASLGANTNKNPYPNFDTSTEWFYYDPLNKKSDVDYLTDSSTAKEDSLIAAGVMAEGKVLSHYAPSAEESTETTTENNGDNKINILINQMMKEDGPSNGSIWNKENTSAFKWSYINGCMASAFINLYYATGDSKYKDFADNYMSEFIGTSYSSSKGYIADNNFKITNYTLDDLNSGKALISLIANGSSNSSKYTNAVSSTLYTDMLQYMRKNQVTSEGNLWHKKSYPYQVWLDGIYMETPFWLEYELEIADNADAFITAANDVAKQIDNVYNNQRNSSTGLYYHGYDSRADSGSGDYSASSASSWASSGTGTSSNYWLRGTGWYAMALVDNIEIMQKAEKKYNIEPELRYAKNDLINIYTELMDDMLKYRDPENKLWYQVIDNPKKDGYNYFETSGSAAMSYALMKGANLGIIDDYYYDYGLETFNSLCDNKLLYSNSSNTEVTLKDICLTAGLGGTSSSATIGPKHTSRDGSYEYYVSEKTVENDAKGVAPLLFAYGQTLIHDNGIQVETSTETTTEVSSETTTKVSTETTTEASTETTTEATTKEYNVGAVIGNGSGKTNVLDTSTFSSGTYTSSATSSDGVFTINGNTNANKSIVVNSSGIKFSGGGSTNNTYISANVNGPAKMTIKYYSTAERKLEIKSSDGSFVKTASTTANGSISNYDTVSYDISKADKYYMYSTNSSIFILEVRIEYPADDTITLGDVDLNGTIDNSDAAMLLKHISNIITITDEKQITAGDSNSDGKLTLFDVIAIIKYIS